MRLSNINSSDAYFFVNAYQSNLGNILTILNSAFDSLANVGMNLTTTQLNVKNTTFSRVMQSLTPLFAVQLNKAGQDASFEDVTIE